MASEDSSLAGIAGHLAISDQDIFTFQDDNYHSDFKQRLQCMRGESCLTDVTLKAGEVSVRCHKVVLAAASTYFYQLFNTDHAPSTVTLDGISPKVLEHVVDFVYMAQLEMPADLVMDLSGSCEKLKLTSLKKGCDQYIADKVQPSNAMSLHMFAIKYHLEEALKATEKCLLEKPQEVYRLALAAEYQELSQEALIHWISNDDLQVPEEDIVFNIVESWVQADPSRNREACIADVLSYVKLPLCSPEFLVQRVRKSPLVQFNKCRRYVDDAVEYSVLKFRGISTDNIESERTKPRKSTILKLVLVGGISNGVANNQCWILDRGDKWKELTILPQEQQNYPYYFKACALDDGIVVAGGCQGSLVNPTQKAWFYNFSSKIWTALPPMNQARAEHAMLPVNKEVYVFGGYAQEAGGLLSSVEKLDQVRQTWTSIAPMPVAAHWNHAFVIGGDIYVVCLAHKKTLKYTINTSTWQVMADIPNCVFTASAINIGEDIYIVGSAAGYNTLRYNIASNIWTTLAKTKHKHQCGFAVQHEGSVVLTGGGSHHLLQSCLSTSEKYDPTTDQWLDSTFVLPKPLGGHAICSLK